MSTFQERLEHALGGPYEPSYMRRSLQTVILFEAHRCLEASFSDLRSFQRKAAFYNQAFYLLDSINISSHHREEVFWRTASSKLTCNEESLWNRMRRALKEVGKLAEDMEIFAKEYAKDHRKARCESRVNGSNDNDHHGKPEHYEVYRAFVQKKYQSFAGSKDEKFPRRFEFTHSHTLIAYKMYYNKGTKLDQNFPKPLTRPIAILLSKPNPASTAATTAVNVCFPAGVHTATSPAPTVSATRDNSFPMTATKTTVTTEPSQMQQQTRMEILKEVREHMDLLKQFEGAVDTESLNKRKRELFAAMPSAPPAKADYERAATTHVSSNDED